MATLEKLEKNRVKLTIEVSAEDFAKAMQQAYFKNVKHYNVPGFRKGKAPRKVIETMYGEGVFYEDAFELVWGDAYDKAVEENALIPVDRPSIGIEKIGAAEGVVFTAEVQLKPEVTLGAYEGIEVEEPTYTVSDDEIEAALKAEQEKNCRFIDVERPVENGDRIVLDYSGSVDGVKFDGGTAEDQTLVIGSHMFIPGFEEQCVGMQAGEEKDITVTFPEDYTDELKGKEAVFAIKVKAVQIKELPTIDDEFVKDISEFDTVDEWKADKRRTLEAGAEENRRAEIGNRALKIVSDNAEVEIPDCMIDRQVDYMLEEMAYRLQMSGLSLEQYMQYTGTDADKLKESYRTEAAARVKTQLVIEAVTKAQDIQVTDEETDKQIAEYIKQGPEVTLDSFKKGLSEDDLDYFRDRAVVEKTVQYIIDNVKLVPEKAKDEETPKAE